MSQLPWPHARWWGLVGAILVGATVISTLGVLTWGPPQWTTFTSIARERILIPGIVAASAAAWLGQGFGKKSVSASPIAPKSGEAARRQIGHLILLSTGAYLVGVMPAIVYTAHGADAGRIDILTLLSQIAALAAVGSVSFLLSVLISHRWSLLLAPLGSLIFVVLPPLLNPVLGTSERSTRQASVVWFNDFPLPGWQVTAQTSAFRLALFTLVALACITTAQRIVGGTSTMSPYVVIGSWITVTVMVVTSVWLSPPLVTWAPGTSACTESASIKVCLYPSFNSLSKEVHAIAEQVVEVTGKSTEPLTIQQGSPLPGDNQSATVWMNLNGLHSSSDLKNAIVEPMSYVLSGGPACSSKLLDLPPEADIPADLNDSLLIQGGIAGTIQTRLGMPTVWTSVDEVSGQRQQTFAQEALDKLSDDQFREWMEQHSEMISECSLKNLGN